jgi:hypothetical protein
MAFFAHDGLFYGKLKLARDADSLVASIPEDPNVTLGTRRCL